MAAMVLVNNPGDWNNLYWPLGHAPWDGWTPTDLIFPFFLFIVGVAITLSRKLASPRSIVIRALKLIGLGLFLSGFPTYHLSTMRFPGVLQRIGICYLAAAFAYRWARGDAAAPRPDRAVAARLGGMAIVLLLGYWLALLIIPGAGGQRYDLTAEGNIGAAIDRFVFGAHLWQRKWDPEGLLSTIPAIGTTLVGLLAGLWMKARADQPQAVLRGLVYGGLLVTLVGAVWGLVFPPIKNIWTSSYALFGAGMGSLVFALCYWALDIRGWTRWAQPFVVLGVNAITLFVVSGLVGRLLLVWKVPGPFGKPMAVKTWLYKGYFEPLAAPANASLIFAVTNLILLYGLLWWMYRRNIILKV
jgi:predicted acyltransferase